MTRIDCVMWTVAGLLVVGCPSDKDSDAASDAGAETAGEQDASESTPDAAVVLGPDVKVGEFGFQLVPADPDTESEAFTQLFGKVKDGPAVDPIIWDVQSEQGGCTLLTPRVPFCDPACGSDVCVEEDTCKANPAELDVGRITVEGLRNQAGEVVPFDVTPSANSYQIPNEVELRYPAFDEGDAVRVEVHGNQVEAFSLEATGIAPLEITDQGLYLLESDKPLEIHWKQPTQLDAASPIHVDLDISHHGGSKGRIECSVPDDGALSIPAELVTQLIELGVGGFPSVVLTRSSVGTQRTSVGRVELKLYSPVVRFLEVSGFTSCTQDGGQCSVGQICQANLTCGPQT